MPKRFLQLGSLVLLGLFVLTNIAFAQPTRPGNTSPTTPGAICRDDSDTWIFCNSSATFGDASAAIANGNFTLLTIGTLTLSGDLHVDDDLEATFGNTYAAPDVRLGWNTAQTVDALYLGLSTAQNTFVIGELGDIAFDFSHGAQTNPTLYVHSASQSTGQFISLAHNQTDGVIDVGTGVVSIPDGFNSTTGTLTTSLILQDPGAGVNTITIQAPAALAASYTLTQPPNNGDAGQFLQTDGEGVLSFAAAAASELVSATLATASGATAATVANSSGITWNIPVSGADANPHTWTHQIDGTTFLSATATGDGAGGIGTITTRLNGVLRIADSTNVDGLTITPDAGGTVSINSISLGNHQIIFQNQSFTPLATHGLIQVLPTWTTGINQAVTAFTINATQQGANNQSLTALTLQVTKSAAGTLAVASPLKIETPNASATIASNIAVDVNDQTCANCTATAFMRTQSGIANAWRVGNSVRLYSSGAEVLNLRDSTETGGFNFTLSAASNQTITSLGNMTLNPSTGIIESTANAASWQYNLPITGVDAGAHSFNIQIDGTSFLALQATGNGGGGITSPMLNVGPSNGSIAFTAWMSSDIAFQDNFGVQFGNTFGSPDFRLYWNTSQTVDAAYLSTATAQNVLLIAEEGDRAFDFQHGAQTNPTPFIHSATQSTTQWLSLTHNQTDGVITTGTGALSLSPASGVVNVNGLTTYTAGVAFTGGSYQAGRNNDATNRYQINIPTSSQLEFSGNDTERVVMQSSGALAFTQAPAGSGSTGHFAITPGSHSNLTASTEVPDFAFIGARSVAWAAGNLNLQRQTYWQAATISITGGASTVTEAILAEFSNAPSTVSGTGLTQSRTVSIGASGTQTYASSWDGLHIVMSGIASGFGSTSNWYGQHTGSGTGSPSVSLGNQTANVTNLVLHQQDAVTFTSTTNVRTVTGNFAGTVFNAPVAGTNVTASNGAWAAIVDTGNMKFDGWDVTVQNSIAAANDFTPTSNSIYVTGATQINRIAPPPGSATHAATLKLIFASNPVVKHNQATGGGFNAIFLAGSADYNTAANGTLTLEWDVTNQRWQELARKGA